MSANIQKGMTPPYGRCVHALCDKPFATCFLPPALRDGSVFETFYRFPKPVAKSGNRRSDVGMLFNDLKTLPRQSKPRARAVDQPFMVVPCGTGKLHMKLPVSALFKVADKPRDGTKACFNIRLDARRRIKIHKGQREFHCRNECSKLLRVMSINRALNLKRQYLLKLREDGNSEWNFHPLQASGQLALSVSATHGGEHHAL